DSGGGENESNFCCALSCGSLIKNRQRKSQSTSLLPPAGCGGELIRPTGAFTSPGYPDKYPANRECIWHIQTSPGIFFNFTDLDVESHSSCGFDYVAVSITSNLFPGRYCGNELPHPVTSFSNALVVNFISDASVGRKGFRATYMASTSGCGGHLYMESGAFNSPNYPDVYPPNVECVWTITSSPGNRLQLSFIMFQLQQSSDCSNDYLEVREGHSTGTLDGRFCGDSLPSNYTSIMGHILWIQFVSDSSVSGAGFRAVFSHCSQSNGLLFSFSCGPCCKYQLRLNIFTLFLNPQCMEMRSRAARDR
uniref:CUB domain-containing protein n=1 Tax=Sinocyclocheilus anshuiensis TaxID=1608454 RepID=A0A671NKB8_9TELE